MLNLGAGCALATTCGQRTPHQIECRVALLDMRPGWCMHWEEQRVSQYKVSTWMGVGQNLAGQFAKDLCSVVDGSSMNKAC